MTDSDDETFDRGRGRRRGHRGWPGHGLPPMGAFGADGPFGPGGPFGRGGPFGPGGPFGAGGPMGPGARRGRRGHVRSAILALLADEPLNGYQIMQSLAERTQGAWKPSPGAVYPALSQLEDEGLIESFDNQGQKAFRLTEAGRQAAEQVRTPPWEIVNEAVAGFNPDQVRKTWAEFGSLAGAVKELSRHATVAQLDAAAKLLADTRRRLYGLLAEDTAEGHSDDLR